MDTHEKDLKILIRFHAAVYISHVSDMIHWPTISMSSQYYYSLDCKTVVQQANISFITTFNHVGRIANFSKFIEINSGHCSFILVYGVMGYCVHSLIIRYRAIRNLEIQHWEKNAQP
jgi:hypothetical protein